MGTLKKTKSFICLKTIGLTLAILLNMFSYGSYGQTTSDSTGTIGLDLDGIDDHIEIADNSSLDFTNQFTIEAWVKPENTGNFQTVISKFSSSGGGQRSWAILILPDGRLEMSLSNNGSSENFFFTSGFITFGQWNHIAYRFNGTTMNALINGVEDPNNQNTTSNIFNSSQPILIGARDNGSGPELFLDGIIDEVRLWNIVRTDSAIVADKNCLIPSSASGLVAHYHFDQGLVNGDNTSQANLMDGTTNNNLGIFRNIALNDTSSNFVIGAVDSVSRCSSPLLVDLIVDSVVSCNGGSNGGVSTNVSGGVPPYTYLWSNGDTTASITNLNAGTYSVTIKDNNGAMTSLTQTIIDSAVVTEPIALFSTIDTSICNGDSIVVNGTTYNSDNPTGVEVFTNIGPNNCDSVVTIDLQVTTIDTVITVNNNTLSVNSSGATFQWIDCKNLNPISDETNAAFTATANGSYGVVVTKNSCVDTSACYNIVTVGLTENAFNNDFKVFPNPVKNELTISFNEKIDHSYSISIQNSLGQIIQTYKPNNQKVEFNLSELEQGVYFVRVSNSKGNKTIRVIKQ